MINDKVAKASADVKAGDIIEISFGNKNVKVKVTDVKDTVKKEEAKENGNAWVLTFTLLEQSVVLVVPMMIGIHIKI